MSHLLGWLLSTVLVEVFLLVRADFYNPRYDDFDIEPLVSNDRILLSYTKCFLDQGPCTPDAKDFKRIIPEAIETSCAKCTPKQKKMIKAVIKTVMEQHKDAWDELVEKYDKDKLHREDFDKFLQDDK